MLILFFISIRKYFNWPLLISKISSVEHEIQQKQQQQKTYKATDK